MQKRANKSHLGFTLIEIMIVLFIFMIMMTMIVMNTNFNYTDEKKLSSFSENLLAKIKLAKQTALFQHTPVRLVVEKTRYGFQKYQRVQSGYQWMWIERDSLLGPADFDEDIMIRLESELALLPNGRSRPFKVIVEGRKNNIHFEIEGDGTGQMELKRK